MRTLLVFSFVFLACSQPALSQFEGVIDMKITTHAEEGQGTVSRYTISVKNDLLAAKMQSTEANTMQNGSFIFRGDKQVLWIVNDDEKMYYEFDVKEGKKKSEPSKKSLMKKPRKTGKTETILGYACEEYVMEEDENTTSLWVTPKLGSVYEGLRKSFEKMSMGDDGRVDDGWEEALAQMKVFPLKVVESEAGVVKETQEVTKVEKKSVPVSAFQVPAGYKKQSLEEEMQKMMQGMGGGDSSMSPEDMQKLMQDMQLQMEKMQKDLQEKVESDSSEDDEEQ